MRRVITIDGPSGSGKSVVARRLSQVLFFNHLNSGLIYRGLTSVAISSFGWSTQNDFFVRDLVSLNLHSCFTVDFDKKGYICIFFNGVLVDNLHMNSLEVSSLVPLLSQIESVRDFVKTTQHGIANKFDIVADGRDCGVEVFPKAFVKIYLTATLEQRSKRVFERSLQQGLTTTLDETRNALALRDHADETRSVSPLRKAADAVVIDSTNLTIMDVLKKIICVVAKNL